MCAHKLTSVATTICDLVIVACIINLQNERHRIQLQTDITIKNTHPLNVIIAGRNLEQCERLMGQVDHSVELLHVRGSI